ncbi:hypothetical protein ACWIID_42350 [Streptomyces phaeochromogenes]
MDDTEEEDSRTPEETPDPSPHHTPPLRPAGIGQDDIGEPHVVRGID